MRNAHCKTKNKARSEKNVKNETNTIWPGISRETIKLWKKSNALTRIWSMARKLKIMENEKHTLQDIENCQKSEKREQR